MNNLFNYAKWKLLFKVLPFTVLFALGKSIGYYFDFQPWKFDSLTGSLFGAVTFILAFILSGTINDYHASEKMILELQTTLENIEDSNQVTAMRHKEYNPVALTKNLLEIINCLLAWLKKNESYDDLDKALKNLNLIMPELAEYCFPPVFSLIQTQQSKIKLLLYRIKIIRDTDFLQPAYALLELFLVGAVTALLLISTEHFSESLMVSSFLFTSFCYLLLLIRDLDNPFEYDGSTCVDIDLTPLENLQIQLTKNISNQNSDSFSSN